MMLLHLRDTGKIFRTALSFKIHYMKLRDDNLVAILQIQCTLLGINLLCFSLPVWVFKVPLLALVSLTVKWG